VNYFTSESIQIQCSNMCIKWRTHVFTEEIIKKGLPG